MRYLSLVAFLALVVGGGSWIGVTNTPGEWYTALEKPPFNPPNRVFGPVWTILYIMIAVVGWRVWQRAELREAMWVWWFQLGLNFLWSPVFFTWQAPGAALVVIIALLATILTFIGLVWKPDRFSGALFIPYAAWVAFATLLNLSIFVLN